MVPQKLVLVALAIIAVIVFLASSDSTPARARAQNSSPPPIPGKKVDPQDVPKGHYVLDPRHASVNWVINHLGFSDFHGRFDKVEAKIYYDPKDLAAASVDATVDVSSVYTGVAKLDEEIRGAMLFNASAYPKISFRSTDLNLTGSHTGKLTGQLSMGGKTHAQSFDVTFTGAGVNPHTKAYTLGFRAETTLKRSQWDLNAWLPAVSDEVRIVFSAEFSHQKDEDKR